MSKNSSFDLIVIGGGPGGYVAAIRASQLGMNVALVEKEHLGGICLNWGCIPTKALLKCSEVNHMLQNLDHYGFKAQKIEFDLQKIVQRSRKVSQQLSAGIKHLLKKNKVTVFNGHGRLEGKNKVLVTSPQEPKKQTITSPHIIIAAGARARHIPGIKVQGKRVWTYKNAMMPEKLPKSILVVGSGAIGVEFASFYRDLGVEVTIIEMMPDILPVEDSEISKFMRKQFESQGMKIFTEAKLKAINVNANAAEVSFEHSGKTLKEKVDHVILAVGIEANTEELGLDKTAVKLEKGHIVINEWCETHEPGVYAIGDIVGPPWLAHKASHEGVICVEKIAGKNNVHPLNTNNIPGCTYSRPQVASVGLTERAAKEKGYSVNIGRFPFIGNGKAIAMGETEGMIKTIFDQKTGELLGAHMAGAEVTEMIQGFTVAKSLETTEEELMHTVFPHPTLSEMMHESVLDAFGKAIHF